ncbi:MAG: alpha-ketoglutarate-dependent dioxygenase AlkB, partial [Defluviicoccus sp.]|nr:alpha-ketoglutarate-dependent dioxygenase AlkB [Defluviicoccus sp.]
PDIVTEAEQQRILLRISQAPWMTDLSRRVQHYGYRYDYRGSANGRHDPAPPFPRWATVIGERLSPFFDGAMPEQCIVNEYRPGQGIGMHADHASFGDVVVSLSLGDAWTMNFRPRSARPYVREGLASDEVALLPRRSALVLRGQARSSWMHGIDRAANARRAGTRVSATFRTVSS